MKRGWKIILNFLVVLLVLFSLQKQAATAIPTLTSSQISQLFYQGIENTKHQNYQQALSDFTEVINLKTNFVSAAYSNRCLIHLQLGNNQAAKSDCTAALALNPDNLESYLNQGLAEYRLGNYQGAINQYQEVIQRQENDYRAYYNQGLAYFALRDYGKAVQNYDQALLSETLSSSSIQALIYSDKGLSHFLLGNHAQAIADLNQAINLNADNEKAYYNRACVYAKTKNYADALTDYTKALALNPSYGEAYLNRGLIRHGLGLEQGAIKDLNQALQVFKQQDNTEAYQKTLSFINQLQEILAQTRRTVVS